MVATTGPRGRMPGGGLMSCSINTSLCIACYNCQVVCPRGAIVENTGTFAIRSLRCNDCRQHKSGPRCRQVCPIEGAICTVNPS